MYKNYTKCWTFLLIITVIVTIYEIIATGNQVFSDKNYCEIYKYSGWCNADIAQIISTIYLLGFMFIINKANN